MPYNLASPNGLIDPVDPANVARWLVLECHQIESEAIRHVVLHVAGNLKEFLHWPEHAVLLWQGCNRIKPEGTKQKYHAYPMEIRQRAKQHGLKLDSRPNGPARASFELAGGVRPIRFGSSNGYTAHHLYSGKFPYLNRVKTLHSIKEGDHFTQSAGVVVAHPIADALCDEFPFFAWRLRYEAFQRFGYDPDGVFSPKQNELGFAETHTCEVFLPLPTSQ